MIELIKALFAYFLLATKYRVSFAHLNLMALMTIEYYFICNTIEAIIDLNDSYPVIL